MGLGGHLMWTAVAREIVKNSGVEKVFAHKKINSNHVYVGGEVFRNNPYFFNPHVDSHDTKIELMCLNNKDVHYCYDETPLKVQHRDHDHIIKTTCAHYGIENPDLRCELYFDEREEKTVETVIDYYGLKKYLIIEPHSKMSYTVNRAYPFDKWQSIVNDIKQDIQVVQIGAPGSQVLDNVINLVGKTTFRTAAKLMENARLFVSTEGGLVHAATCVDTKSLVIITGYQKEKMVAYPQNINLNIANHGPCGMRIQCDHCKKDAENHDYKEVSTLLLENIK